MLRVLLNGIEATWDDALSQWISEDSETAETLNLTIPKRINDLQVLYEEGGRLGLVKDEAQRILGNMLSVASYTPIPAPAHVRGQLD